MVNYDHYQEARELAEQLREEKLDGFADKIIGAIEAGSTGTEIFMSLRWNIENLLKTGNHSFSNAIKDKASRLNKELNKALQ
jgi:gamma-glutamyl-gamma-aminobutyrate hydrolase PuuD